MSAIAHWDWPEAWPDLFPVLMQALTSGDPNAVHGAMRVLAGKAIELKNVWCLMPISSNELVIGILNQLRGKLAFNARG